jgi:hypothetical protein
MGDRKRRKQRRTGRRPATAGDDPFVTIAQYGPDDQTVTKVVASAFRHQRQRSGKLKRWVGTGITESATFRKELLELIKESRARRIVLTRGVIGCIHEEGKDYPKGQDCPFCPFWRGRDRWANAKDLYQNRLTRFQHVKPHARVRNASWMSSRFS